MKYLSGTALYFKTCIQQVDQSMDAYKLKVWEA